MSRVRDGTINFSKLYTKLHKPIFPTIRHGSDHGEVYQKVAITLNHDQIIGLAWIIQRINTKLKRVPSGILTHDTGRESREEAIEELKKHYPDLEPEDQVELYVLGWIDSSEEAGPWRE